MSEDREMYEADQIRLWRLQGQKSEIENQVTDKDFERIFHDSGLEFVKNKQNFDENLEVENSQNN